MTIEPSVLISQLTVLFILAGALIFFLRNRIRYDVVALLVMLAVVAVGVMPYESALANFGHPAVIIVACMFIMSEAFVRSGAVDAIVGRLPFLHHRPIIALGFMVFLVAFLSAFINNAGALAMVIPIALHLARKSNAPISLFLLPLAFASHLGGFMTLIGTPRNIIISDFREQAVGAPFLMFDFFYVGGVIALLGCLFLIAISWRFIPMRRKPNNPPPRSFTTEVTILPHSKVANLTVAKFKKTVRDALAVVSVYRDGQPLEPVDTLGLLPDDRLIIRGDIDTLTQSVERYDLSLTGLRAHEQFVTNADEQASIEVVVPPYAKLVGHTWESMPLTRRFGTNFIGIYRREGAPISELSDTKIWPNDILLLHGRTESINETISALRLLPIANSEVPLGRPSTIAVTLLVLVGAILIATLNVLPLALVFLAAAVALILLNLVSLRQAYESVDQTVLILLAGMLTLGEALQISGADETLARLLLGLSDFVGPAVMLGVVLVASMLVSDFMNTTASAVIMAPIAIFVAQSLNASVDPFLIAVAIGASSAFLTPIGHESNAIVMRRGGYTFKDYFRIGLPLEIIIVVTSLPLILHFWPL
jgi:di/tricarboxylate transporter